MALASPCFVTAKYYQNNAAIKVVSVNVVHHLRKIQGFMICVRQDKKMSCPSCQWHRTGSHWSPVRTLPVAPLWCDLGFFPNSRDNKVAANLRPKKIEMFDFGIEPAPENFHQSSALSTPLPTHSKIRLLENLRGALRLSAPRGFWAPRASGASATQAPTRPTLRCTGFPRDKTRAGP